MIYYGKLEDSIKNLLVKTGNLKIFCPDLRQLCDVPALFSNFYLGTKYSSISFPMHGNQ